MTSKVITLTTRLLLLVAAFAAPVLAGQDFDGSSGYAASSTASVTAAPLSFSAYVKSDSDSALQTVVGVYRPDTSREAFELQLRGDFVGDPARCNTMMSNANSSGCATTSGYTVGTWHNVVGTFLSSTERHSYIDGGSEGTSTTNQTPASISQTVVGRRDTLDDTFYFDGAIAEVGIWSVPLSLADRAALGRGYAPDCVRPDALQDRYAMIKDATTLKDTWRGKNNLTLNGTTSNAAHPRVIPCQ